MGSDEKFPVSIGFYCRMFHNAVYQLRRVSWGFYQELDQYEARREYEEWLDKQEDDMIRLHEQELSPEVVDE